jgi:hypothetical protein
LNGLRKSTAADDRIRGTLDCVASRLADVAAAVNAALADLKSPTRIANEAEAVFRVLWACGNRRVCEISESKEGVLLCSFRSRIRDYATATGIGTTELGHAVHQWIDRRCSSAELQKACPSVRPEDCAAWFEAGRGIEWHWKALLDRARGPRREPHWDPATEHRELIELLSSGSVARRFWTFTSHFILCFSRCPDFPFSTRGLPKVDPPASGKRLYHLAWGKETAEGDARDIAARLETGLLEHVGSIFDGSVTDLLESEVNGAFRAAGLPLNAHFRYEGPWERLLVDRDGRHCQLDRWASETNDDYVVDFRPTDPRSPFFIRVPMLQDVIGVVRRWLIDRCSPSQLTREYPTMCHDGEAPPAAAGPGAPRMQSE